ncbi:MAG: GDSL-type esterase/lipase family protein [Candidatus Rokuibacteriota bacterium]
MARTFLLGVVALALVACGGSDATTAHDVGESFSPRAEDPVRVLVLGDSVTVDGSPGIRAALEATGAASVTLAAGPAAGLTTDYDWRTEYLRLIAEHRPDVVVLMFGGEWDLPTVKKAPERYDEIVAEATQMITADDTRLVLIGMPPHPPGKIDDSLRRRANRSFEAAAAIDKVEYLSPEPIFANAAGQYTDFLPDPEGVLARIRKVDGTHICPEGAARLGDAVRVALGDTWELPDPDPTWWFGPWRNDALYTDSNVYEYPSGVLTTNVCPPPPAT